MIQAARCILLQAKFAMRHTWNSLWQKRPVFSEMRLSQSLSMAVTASTVCMYASMMSSRPVTAQHDTS